MTRLDELTGKLLDGILTDTEWEELEGLLRADVGCGIKAQLLTGTRRRVARIANRVRSGRTDARQASGCAN